MITCVSSCHSVACQSNVPGGVGEHERAAFENLEASGVKELYYLEGKDLLGDDGEATVDGSHPTDLGMLRYATAYEHALRPLLR